jgi:hypothetical protein
MGRMTLIRGVRWIIEIGCMDWWHGVGHDTRIHVGWDLEYRRFL